MTDSEKKLARKRLRILKLAQKLGNVSEACRRLGVSRSQYYQYKRRFQDHGLEGLVDRPPIHKSHPQTTPPEIVRQILDLAVAFPDHGCHRLSDLLLVTGVSVSGVTIQKILAKNGMRTRYKRMLKLEEKVAGAQTELTSEQRGALEKINPCFREGNLETTAPATLLCQDTLYIGTFKGVGKVYLQAVVDTHGSLAFGYLHTGKSPKHAVAILHKKVIPHYNGWGLEVEAVLTHNGGTYCGSPSHPYELYLALTNISHRRPKERSSQTHGFVKRFHRTVMDEFLSTADRPKSRNQLAALQEDLDAWLERYNFERPHQGYPNWGKRPADMVMPFAKSVWENPMSKIPVSILPFWTLMELLNQVRRGWPRNMPKPTLQKPYQQHLTWSPLRGQGQAALAPAVGSPSPR